MKKLLQSFFKKQDGVVAIIVAVALAAILFGVLSLSIDLNRTQTSYTHNYNGTDAAALAAAEMWLQAKIDAIGKVDDPLDFRPSEGDVTNYAKQVLETNFAQDQSSSAFLDNTSFKVTMDENRLASGKTRFTVKVDACALLSTPIASVPNHNQDDKNPGKAKTCTTSTAGFDLGKLENAEVAFALDFTESMYWQGKVQGCPPGNANPGCLAFEQTKAAKLQTAMKYVFETYFDATKEGTAFASIVPYTSFVNIWPYDDNGVVTQGTDKIDFKGKAFFDVPLKADGTYGTKAEQDAFYANPTNAWSQYYPIEINKTIGRDLKTYSYDPEFFREQIGEDKSTYAPWPYRPFFTYDNYNYDGTERYGTENYSSILNRVPTIDEGKLERIIDNPDNTSFLPFNNYHNLVNYIAAQRFVSQKELYGATSRSTNPEEQYAKMICYQYTVAAAADERIDRGPLTSSDYSKVLTGSPKSSTDPHGTKNTELHEAYVIQPLTNDVDVLNNILDRYIATDRLSTGNVYNNDKVVDFQSTRIDKARLKSKHHKTSSIHGLMWAWFTINNAWQGKWDKESVTETYLGGTADVRTKTGEELPSAKNFKHIILISDGFDNDGCNEMSGGTGDNQTGIFLGKRNVCDAYAPVAAVTDKQYTDLCTAIKTNNTPDEGDDTSIHMVTLDFDPKTGEVNDGICDKKGGKDNRFAKCATTGEYYENVQPAALEKMFDNIFAGILTNAVSVRLID